MWETPFFLVFRVVVCRVLYSQHPPKRWFCVRSVIVFVCGKLVSCPGRNPDFKIGVSCPKIQHC